jgi:hypothetical protein
MSAVSAFAFLRLAGLKPQRRNGIGAEGARALRGLVNLNNLDLWEATDPLQCASAFVCTLSRLQRVRRRTGQAPLYT